MVEHPDGFDFTDPAPDWDEVEYEYAAVRRQLATEPSDDAGDVVLVDASGKPNTLGEAVSKALLPELMDKYDFGTAVCLSMDVVKDQAPIARMKAREIVARHVAQPHAEPLRVDVRPRSGRAPRTSSARVSRSTRRAGPSRPSDDDEADPPDVARRGRALRREVAP